MGMRVIVIVRCSARGEVEGLVEHKGGVDYAVCRCRDRRGAQRAQAFGQLSGSCGVGEISLCDDDAVGERDLMARLGGMVEIAGAARRIDDRDEPLEVIDIAERALAGDRLQHRSGIGEAARFDDDALETRHPAPAALGKERAQGFLQIGSNRAAQAAIAEQHGRVARRAQQRVVDADLAELVDDDGGVGPLGLGQQFADQRRLAGAEKAGNDRDRQAGAARAALSPPERARITAGKWIGHQGRTPAHIWVRMDGSPSPRPSPRKRGEGELADLSEISFRSICFAG